MRWVPAAEDRAQRLYVDRLQRHRGFTKNTVWLANSKGFFFFCFLRPKESSPSSKIPISCRLISVEPMLFHV